MTNTAAFEEAAGEARTPTGHPKGLYVLFGAEMWERFSYYGMRALLVLYLTKHLHMKREDALALYGTYTGLVYLTPLIGGYLADKFLGQRKAILVGGTVMAMGHFAMAFEDLLYVALGLLMLGNGFFKPNISTMVGQLYPQGDARRDSAYTIFYMGINLGAFFSPLVCGSLGESSRFGWHYGFGAAGVGMVIGLIVFTLLQRLLGTGGYPPGRAEAGEARLKAMDWVHVALISLACLGFVYGALAAWPSLRPLWSPKLSGLLLLAYRGVIIFALGLLVKLATHLALQGKRAHRRGFDARTEAEKEGDLEAPFSKEEWQRIGVILIVALFSIVFWMGFEQAGGTLNLFADEKTDRSLPTFLTSLRPFGYQLFPDVFPASWFQSVNPLLIVLLAPFPLMVWSALDRTRFALTSTAKMGIGLILLGVGFVVMAGAERAAVSGKVSSLWLASVYLLFTLGELCLSPIGLSLVNKLAPARVASLMMAVWFLCTAAANYLAGNLENILKANDLERPETLWTFLIFSSIVPGILLLLLTPILKKMGHGRI
jgi:POT family proton-dependent oligopeptide transporter